MSWRSSNPFGAPFMKAFLSSWHSGQYDRVCISPHTQYNCSNLKAPRHQKCVCVSGKSGSPFRASNSKFSMFFFLIIMIHAKVCLAILVMFLGLSDFLKQLQFAYQPRRHIIIAANFRLLQTPNMGQYVIKMWQPFWGPNHVKHFSSSWHSVCYLYQPGGTIVTYIFRSLDYKKCVDFCWKSGNPFSASIALAIFNLLMQWTT